MKKHEQNYNPKTSPLDHQLEAINYLAENTKAALFDEQGLGKTKIVIDALSIAMMKKQIQGALIVAPLSLVYNWEQEVSKHSFLIPIVLRGTKKEKKYKFLTGANFYITNYEAIVSELDRIRRFCRSRKIAIVLDEATRIKDPETRTATSLFEIAPLAFKRIVVTGTPIANKPYDVWSLFYFLDQGKLLGESYKKFRSQFDEKRTDYFQKLKDLQQIIEANSIRRLKGDVLELPEKIFKNVSVELSGKQLELYNEIRTELSVEIIAMDGSTFIDEVENILKKLLRLSQAACNPLLLNKNFKDIPAKFPPMLEIVQKAESNNEKVIIWTNFVDNIFYIKEYLKDFNPLVIYGDIPVDERVVSVKKFQESEKYKVLIANPSAAREGLTLTRANNAIYFDRSFNLVDYLQSQDRIHRISQTKYCVIYKFIARNTIDEYIDRIIDLKTDIARYLEGDTKILHENTIKTLTNKQQLLQMLGG